MNKDVFVTSTGKFFPNDAVSNDEMESFLGKIGGQQSRVREKILRQNKITSRHYALDRSQRTTHSNAEMTASAIHDALTNAGIDRDRISYLAAATSQGDFPLPGFASMVHGELGNRTCEIATLHGVCSSSLMALKSAYLEVASGGHDIAVACAGEIPSRLFKSSRFDAQASVKNGEGLPFDAEFLRWMLSDGAGAAILSPIPAASGLSLKIEWVRSFSHANRYAPCMYVGEPKSDSGKIPQSWLDFPTYQAAAEAGAINLRQDIRMLKEVVKCAADGLFQLMEEGVLRKEHFDWFLCHYSSHVFREEAEMLLRRGGVEVSPERWFTNLYTRGNVGSASLLVMMDELFHSGKLVPGQHIVCLVPESGRFNFGYMLLKVVGGEARGAKTATSHSKLAPSAPPTLHTSGSEIEEQLVRQLARVWFDFEAQLARVPMVQRLNQGTFSIQDYRAFLYNLRQQVIDGSRWISRAASNITGEFFPIRSAFIGHSSDEHRDYEMIERDFASVGGELAQIRSGEKNIGSEALSAFILSRAARENPFDLVGAMFIIEGLGQRIARGWGEAIRDQLNLTDQQVSFLIYHSASDVKHFERLDLAIQSGILTPKLVSEIVKTAKVTARLYALQLEEIGNF